MKVNDLKPGMAVTLSGKLFVVVKTEHVKPGKGPAYVQAKLRAVDGSGTTEKRFNSFDTVDSAELTKRSMEYLYPGTDGSATFMAMDTYEQHDLPASIVGDALRFLAPNAETLVLFHDEKPLLIELPASVEVTVTETAPGIKGAPASQLKDATCDTGLQTKVPPFIDIGETIKVSTEDGSYMSRA